MKKDLIISKRLEDCPVKWVKNASHYFENGYKEYWIATVIDNKLLFTGSDIDFEEISLTYKEAIILRNTIFEAIVEKGNVEKPITIAIPIYILEADEALWLSSVITASALQLKG